MPTIALDVMSGDAGLQAAVDAACLARAKNLEWEILLVGDETKIRSALKQSSGSDSSWQVIHTEAVISMDDSPSQAVRRRGTSMRRALELVAEKKADAAVSAGNTGALMGLGVLILRPIKGISRPAIAAFMPNPNPRHSCCMLDLGANATCTPEMLRDFALMGTALAHSIKKVEQPRVGLLNIGEEDHKGNQMLKAAGELLRAHPAINFIGNVEGYAVYNNEVDVIVCDGFSGNVALKVSEGLAQMISGIIRGTLQETILSRLGALLLYPLIAKLRRRLDHRQYNGASMLGLRNVVVKSHGNADKIAFAAAIQTAIAAVEQNLPAIIAKNSAISPPLADSISSAAADSDNQLTPVSAAAV